RLPRRALVARKPQRAAIRAETRPRELIASYSAHSVGRRAICPRGGVGSVAGRPRVVGCVQIGGVRKRRAPQHKPCPALRFIPARCRLRCCLRGGGRARRCSPAAGSAPPPTAGPPIPQGGGPGPAA